jgi:hypothetical protein
MPQGAYLHTAVDHVTFRMIVAKEMRVSRKGFEQWVRKRKENHLLDHEIGTLALADPEWPEEASARCGTSRPCIHPLLYQRPAFQYAYSEWKADLHGRANRQAETGFPFRGFFRRGGSLASSIARTV